MSARARKLRDLKSQDLDKEKGGKRACSTLWRAGMPALPGCSQVEKESWKRDEAGNAHEGARLRLAVAGRTTARARRRRRTDCAARGRGAGRAGVGGARVAARDESGEALDALVVARERRQP